MFVDSSMANLSKPSKRHPTRPEISTPLNGPGNVYREQRRTAHLYRGLQAAIQLDPKFIRLLARAGHCLRYVAGGKVGRAMLPASEALGREAFAHQCTLLHSPN